jgi:hypothetical protein
MEAYALPIYRAGHLPVLGEWLALPLLELAGSKQAGDTIFNEIFHPIAERLLAKCDALLRVGGESQGADLMVEIACDKRISLSDCTSTATNAALSSAVSLSRKSGQPT